MARELKTNGNYGDNNSKKPAYGKNWYYSGGNYAHRSTLGQRRKKKAGKTRARQNNKNIITRDINEQQ